MIRQEAQEYGGSIYLEHCVELELREVETSLSTSPNRKLTAPQNGHKIWYTSLALPDTL